MTHYTFDPPINGIKQWDISLDHELGRGANATVFKVQVGKSYYALKKYQKTSLVDIHKLKAMISNPPKVYTEYDDIDYPLFGWALSIVYSEGAPIGFLMPLVDSEKSKTLDFFYDNLLATKLQSDTSRALSFKIEILANLCEAISDLHDHGHQFVDLKPQNLRVFEGTNVVSLIDCDGYHITDQKTGNEFRADMVSPDYVAPEINELNFKIDRIPKSQDEYALAVIIFQMLNRGIHPYQGILIDDSLDANTNDKKALLGLFPYSQQNHDKIKPPPTSVFSFLLPETQKLFEEAFTKNRRPTAKRWAKHFRGILDQKLVVRCPEEPNDLAHLKFKSQECSACKKPILSFTKSQKRKRQEAPVPEVVEASPSEGLLSKTEQKAIGVVALAILAFVALTAIRDNVETKNYQTEEQLSSASTSTDDIEPQPEEQFISGFKSPTGNIVCGFFVKRDVNSVGCRVIETSIRGLCGNGLIPVHVISEVEKSSVRCLSSLDTSALQSSNVQVLNYGYEIKLGGLNCESTKRGMICKNRNAHGFLISRKLHEKF